MLDKQVACLRPCGKEDTRKRPNDQRTGWRPTSASCWGLVAVHPLRAFNQQTGITRSAKRDVGASDGKSVLADFAAEFPFCAVCWSRCEALHIHHMQQGAGRVHDRRNLLRLCRYCHEGLHFGGKDDLSKGSLLTAKREVDDAHFDPAFLAGLRHKQHLGYGPKRYPVRVFVFRRRNGVPQELILMAINSRQKGKKGELEAAAEWNRLVPKAHARRSQQHSGTESASDLISPGTPHLWLEVKRVQKLNLTEVMDKSREQCGELCPVVLHRKNDAEWLVTFPLEDIKRFVQQVQGAM